jgi:hypothetical protein
MSILYWSYYALLSITEGIAESCVFWQAEQQLQSVAAQANFFVEQGDQVCSPDILEAVIMLKNTLYDVQYIIYIILYKIIMSLYYMYRQSRYA